MARRNPQLQREVVQQLGKMRLRMDKERLKQGHVEQ